MLRRRSHAHSASGKEQVNEAINRLGGKELFDVLFILVIAFHSCSDQYHIGQAYVLFHVELGLAASAAGGQVPIGGVATVSHSPAPDNKLAVVRTVSCFRSRRSGIARHRHAKWSLVFKRTLPMANHRVLRALSRWQCASNCIAEMMVTAFKPALVPDSQQRLSEQTAFLSRHRNQSRVFRGKFVSGLKTAFQTGTLQFHGHLLPLAEPRAFASWLRLLFRHEWVVYSKRPFGGPEHVLRYLGAYTHRVAISNSRLVALANGYVTFRWRDSTHGNKKRLMTLSVDEFLRRFLLHLLPRGFMRIRNFGFLA